MLFALKQRLGNCRSPRQSGTGPVSTGLLLETVLLMIAQGTTAASSGGEWELRRRESKTQGEWVVVWEFSCEHLNSVSLDSFDLVISKQPW